MAEITAGLVKQLREITGAGMMDCKKALQESDAKLDAAQDWLRTKGLSAAAGKAGRSATEGLVGVLTSGNCGVAVEINCETDFVARNETFQAFVSRVSELALGLKGDMDALNACDFSGTGRTVAEELTHMIATIGENMSLRRSEGLCVEQGVIAGYVHNRLADGLGKIGVLVALESEGDADQVMAFGKQLAMHVAAAGPLWLDTADVDAVALERERNVLGEKARESGKPDNVVEKMVEGGVRKFYEENVLLQQVYVMDNKTKIEKVLEDAAGDIGAPVKIAGFIRFALGEGLDKSEA